MRLLTLLLGVLLAVGIALLFSRRLPNVIDPVGSAAPGDHVTSAVAAQLREELATLGRTQMAVGAMLHETASGLQTLAERLEPHYPGARARADSAAAGIAFMLEQWTPDGSLPESYRTDLERDVQVLDVALAAGDVEDAYLLWSHVIEDIEIKAEHCRALGIGLGGLVAVMAHTVRETEPAPGWQVVYIPKLFEVLPNAEPQPFPRLSSPAVDSLAPGRYWVWARRPGTEDRSERVLVKVGAGRSALDVDIPLPRGGGGPPADTVHTHTTQ